MLLLFRHRGALVLTSWSPSIASDARDTGTLNSIISCTRTDMSVQEIVEVDGLGIEWSSRIVLQLNFRKTMLAEIVVY